MIKGILKLIVVIAIVGAVIEKLSGPDSGAASNSQVENVKAVATREKNPIAAKAPVTPSQTESPKTVPAHEKKANSNTEPLISISQDNLVVSDEFCSRVSNSQLLKDLARRVKLQVERDANDSQYIIDTSDKLLKTFAAERRSHILKQIEKRLVETRRPYFIDTNDAIAGSLAKVVSECMIVIRDSELLYLFADSQPHVDHLRKQIKLVLDERRPETYRKIDAAGNVVSAAKVKHAYLELDGYYSHTFNIAWLIALDADGSILKNLKTELMSADFILPGTTKQRRGPVTEEDVSSGTPTGSNSLGGYTPSPNLGFSNPTKKAP